VYCLEALVQVYCRAGYRCLRLSHYIEEADLDGLPEPLRVNQRCNDTLAEMLEDRAARRSRWSPIRWTLAIVLNLIQRLPKSR